jgi:hypothetical protein
MTNSWASCGVVISSTVGMNIPCLESQSMMTRIVVCLLDSRRCSMKSMEIKFHGRSGTGSCLRSP